MEQDEIIKRLKELGHEILAQDNRGTADAIFGITNDRHCLSFFESDVLNELKLDYRYEENNKAYAYSNYNAKKMNELRSLLGDLSTKDTSK